MKADWFRKNSAGFTGGIGFDEPLAKNTYYRIGGPAAVVASPRSLGDLDWLSRGIRETGIDFFILGAGSNLLVADSGFEGLVVRSGRLSAEVAADGAGKLRTGSGVLVSSLLRRAAEEGWGGLEFLSGVPGTIGGVVAMNAGTHLGEAKDRIRSVECFALRSGKLETYSDDALKFQYRRNLFLPVDGMVLSAEWAIDPRPPEEVKKAIDETLARRKATQPVDLPSCGSVFKNPKALGMHAWQVIERLGLRGHRVGGAQFSEKHCNFIVNHGQARASDVKALIELAQSRAKAELGIELEKEVKLLGFHS